MTTSAEPLSPLLLHCVVCPWIFKARMLPAEEIVWLYVRLLNLPHFYPAHVSSLLNDCFAQANFPKPNF